MMLVFVKQGIEKGVARCVSHLLLIKVLPCCQGYKTLEITLVCCPTKLGVCRFGR